MRKLNLRLFDDPVTYSVTCYADDGFTAFSASPGSGAEETTVTLTITPKSGYELDEIQVIAGGVEIEFGEDSVTFDIGEANVVLYAKSKANNKYKVTEECVVFVNGAKTALHKNVEVILTKQGAIEDVQCTPTAITVNDAVQNLIDQGILVKV